LPVCELSDEETEANIGLDRVTADSGIGVSEEKGAIAAFDKEVRMEHGKGGEETGRFVKFWSCRPAPA
jgi:hypothetical protein